jgi:prepilin-type N-terminal cleavage/methylation domain-containing protein
MSSVYLQKLNTQVRKTPFGSPGFTLIEIVVVIAVVSVSFSAIYMMFARNVQQDGDLRREVIASMLAQEGVEMIRNRRDYNVLNNPADMSDEMKNPCYPEFGTVIECGVAGEQNICFKNGHYENGSACTVDTGLDRTCAISGIGAGTTELTVSCDVSWTSGVTGQTRTVTAKSLLTAWQ